MKDIYENNNSSTFIKKLALKDYKTYVAHYESRNLKPVSFSEFLKNYRSK